MIEPIIIYLICILYLTHWETKMPKKTLLITLFVLWLMVWDVWAVDEPYDCGIQLPLWEHEQEMIEQGIGRVSPDPTLNLDYAKMGIQYLWYYCCRTGKLAKDCEKGPLEWPESFYLMDYLVDIGFRRLDGEPALTYGAIQVHPKWAERREKIRLIAEDVDEMKKYTPQTLLALYEEYWQPTGFTYDDLSSKYYLVCQEAEAVRNALDKTFGLWDSGSLGYEWCLALASQRINQENKYIKAIMLKNWLFQVQDNLHKYMQKFFSTNRLMNMMEKITMLSGYLSRIEAHLKEWIPNCTEE